MVVKVLVELSSKNVDKTFDYLVPSHLEKIIQIGVRVLVPFSSQKLEGFVLEINDYSNINDLKEIIEVVDADVVLNKELLDLGKYLQKTTLATLISCYQVMLPKALKAKKGTVVPIKFESVISLSDKPYDYEQLKDNQKEIINIILDEGTVSKSVLNNISLSGVKTLLKNGILQEQRIEKYRLKENSVPLEKYPLTPQQQNVVTEVLKQPDMFIPYLLHGVTGSGKTEVYMEIIEYMLNHGKSSIVLVPEISLTPQIVKRFKGRFDNTVAILHSRLSEGEKYDEWRKIVKGEVSIVIGARSAIFAPLTNIGVIIIDEEQTGSYHQENNPRYHAIEIAMYRGKTHNCPVILGSATPTLESYARAQKGVYHLLELPNRVKDRPLPKIELIDLNKTSRKSNFYFSDELLAKIKDRLEKKEQILLLLNRRGYSSVISCSNCGYIEKCPNCDISLTYHKSSNMLRCHYCGYGTKLKEVCPTCNESSLKTLGVGTEKIEEELTKLLPDIRIVRMDYDTTSRKGSHEKIIEDFSDYRYDVLLGTQMIAKGLDFPNVTLVGVINADTSLNIPDFRSSENTFQLLDQVAGRSGRGDKKGEVVIQTFNPDHYAIVHATKHDYINFYKDEMLLRKKLKYSPFYFMTLIKISSSNYELACDESTKIAQTIKKGLTSSIVLGPSVANVFKVNNIYNFQMIIKYKKEPNLYPILESVIDHYKNNRNLNIQIDFYPTTFV